VTLRTRTARPASEELRAAVHWYESQRPGLGEAFFRAIRNSLDRIKAHPDAGSAAFDDPDVRRILVAGFPYQVVYRYRPNELVILAFAHLRRRPGFWKGRGTS